MRFMQLNSWLCHGFGNLKPSPKRFLISLMHRSSKFIARYKIHTIRVPHTPNKQCVNTSSTSMVSPRVLKKPVSESNYCMDPPTVAGVPVKYGKCVSAKYSVQKSPSTVLLHNRFQCLQDSYDSWDNGVHNVIHTMQSVPIHSDTSVASNAEYASGIQAKQRLQECKPPPSC